MAKYKVIKKNTLKHAVGDVVELTEKQAKALANKVEPIAEPKPTRKPKPSRKGAE